MTPVLNASALAGWLMPDEAGIDRLSLAEGHGVFAAPLPLRAEIRNILNLAGRRGRISREPVDEAIETIGDLGIVRDASPPRAAVRGLCRRHGLTAHDALHLDLALREAAALATLDAARARAARGEGVGVAKA